MMVEHLTEEPCLRMDGLLVAKTGRRALESGGVGFTTRVPPKDNL